MSAKKEKKPKPPPPVRDRWLVKCPAHSAHSYEQWRDRSDGAPPQKQCGGGCTAIVEKSIVETHEAHLAWWAELKATKAGLKEVKQQLKQQKKSNPKQESKPMEKQQTKEAAVTEVIEGSNGVAGTRTALAKVVPVDASRLDLFNPLKWSPEDVEVVRKTVCPAGIPDAEFKLFILKCQASGMNPLLGEAFCVKRRQNIGTRERENWIDVFAFTPGEQGMEGRADDFEDYRGLRAAAVYENDKIVIDASTGEVSHQYNPVDPKRGRLVGAWAIAYREGRKTPVEYVRLEEYVDTRNPKWNAAPHTMIVKCARAAALRRAYPNKFDGIFVREELRDEEGASATPQQVEEANRPTTDALAERMKQTAAAQKDLAPPKADASRPGAQTVPAGQRTVDVKAVKEEKPAAEKTPDEKAAGTASTWTMGLVSALKEQLVYFEILHDLERLGIDVPYTEQKAAEVAAKRKAKGTPEPIPGQLWTKSGGDNGQYKALMIMHGHLVPSSKVGQQAPSEALKDAGAITNSDMDRAGAPPVEEKPVEEKPSNVVKLPSQQADEKKAAEAAKGPVMVYGPKKNQLIASLSGEEIVEMIRLGEAKLPELDTEGKKAKVKACLEHLRAEEKKRLDALAAGDAPAREPGSDDEID